MKTLPPWQRPERWLAFVLTLLGICSFLAIVPVSYELREAAQLDTPALPSDELSFMDYLREGAREVQVLGHWTSLLPPLIAMLVAGYFRSIIGALVSAFAVGSFLSFGLNPLATAVLGFNDYLLKPAWTLFGALVILFLFSLVGMVRVMSRSGGLTGLVNQVGRVAKSRRKAKVSIGFAGLLIFFDDFSNAVVLGTTMQKLSDRWRISREKLAYLVDSTTAPVAGLALLSTWVAYEAYLLGEVSAAHGVGVSGYDMLAEILPMRFYCIGTLIFVFMTSAMGRDFGPMLKAEKRAYLEGKVVDDAHDSLGRRAPSVPSSEPEAPQRWYNAAVPILVVLISIVVGIVLLGFYRMSSAGETFSWLKFQDWRAAFAAAVYSPSHEHGPGVMPVLLIASVIGGIVAVAMPVAQGTVSTRVALASYSRGLPTMWTAVFILVMTWSMREICANLGTAHYLIAMLGDDMPLWILPLLSFGVAAGMSFATGSSWGSMGILFPILLPMAVEMGALESGNFTLFLLTAAAILDGAIFGDHCSPISDTTVLSSISTGCDHIAHVSTQLYYALVTMVFTCVFGYFSVAQKMPIWLYYLIFPIAVAGFLYLFGKKVDALESAEERAST